MNNRLALIACAMTFACSASFAQYPSITKEAQAKYNAMISAERKASDEAWEKALPIVMKEAAEGRP